MQAATKKRLRQILWPIAGLLASVAEVIQSDPEFYTKSWSELAHRGLRALPFLAFSLLGHKLLAPQEEKDAAP